jgi:hypothetical protein
LLSAIFAAMVEFGHVTPGTLLLFMFLIGTGGALSAPRGNRWCLSWYLRSISRLPWQPAVRHLITAEPGHNRAI